MESDDLRTEKVFTSWNTAWNGEGELDICKFHFIDKHESLTLPQFLFKESVPCIQDQ
jgi:hypothetical protein